MRVFRAVYHEGDPVPEIVHDFEGKPFYRSDLPDDGSVLIIRRVIVSSHRDRLGEV